MRVDHVALSRAVSHALRHEPHTYGLHPDAQGWVDVDDLVAALRAVDIAWADLTAGDLGDMVGSSAKRRHELVGGRVRAIYGHSTPARIEYQPSDPPPVLYHGTTAEAAPQILREGLKRGSRQYVHLSGDVETARLVGRRRVRSPVILEVLASEASRAGVQFFRPSGVVWLADFVPPRFVRRGVEDA